MAEGLLDISSFYCGKCILVSGGTGFVGKVLIEKLLWSCRSIKTIYVLVRCKRGISIEQRYSEFIESYVRKISNLLVTIYIYKSEILFSFHLIIIHRPSTVFDPDQNQNYKRSFS